MSIEEAARRLLDAQQSGKACAPVRDLLGAGSVDDAYAVQELVARDALANGWRWSGWKIGLTSPAVQAQLGVDQPDFGGLFAEACVGDGETVAMSRLVQPKVEAEVAFVFDRDLPDTTVTAADVIQATGFVLAAIEIVDSRIENWDITIVDTIADNASSGLYVLGGAAQRLTDVDLGAVTMTMSSDGHTVSTGVGTNCLGHPVNAVVWLANMAARLGRRIKAGDTVLSGALGPMVAVTPGCAYEARIDGLGTARVAFSAEERR